MGSPASPNGSPHGEGATGDSHGRKPLATAFIEDLVIHSESWGDHLDRVLRVPCGLRKVWLVANLRKCHLGLNEARYLGFRFGGGLIRPQEKKVEVVRNAPWPRNKIQVRAFLGLAEYQCCFIPNISSVASPLTYLTKKGQTERLRWSSGAE